MSPLEKGFCQPGSFTRVHLRAGISRNVRVMPLDPSTPQQPSLPLQEGQSLAEGNVSAANAKASRNETAKSLISAIKACSFLPLAVPVESLPQRSDLCKSSFSA